MLLSWIQPITTSSGNTKSAICVDEPMATPRDKSNLPFIAKMTAEACSAALPTIGSTIVARKTPETFCAVAEMESTSASDRKEMNTVMTASHTIA